MSTWWIVFDFLQLTAPLQVIVGCTTKRQRWPNDLISHTNSQSMWRDTQTRSQSFSLVQKREKNLGELEIVSTGFKIFSAKISIKSK